MRWVTPTDTGVARLYVRRLGIPAPAAQKRGAGADLAVRRSETEAAIITAIDPAYRLTWAAGDAAQCDLWFPPHKIPLEDGTTKLLPVLVITAVAQQGVCRW